MSNCMGKKKYEKGGKVEYRDPPMEPVTGEEEKDAFYDELLFETRRAKAVEAKKEYETKVKRRGDDEKVEKYMGGGMVKPKYNKGGMVEEYAGGGIVRGCKGVQVSGKGFKGTF